MPYYVASETSVQQCWEVFLHGRASTLEIMPEELCLTHSTSVGSSCKPTFSLPTEARLDYNLSKIDPVKYLAKSALTGC